MDAMRSVFSRGPSPPLRPPLEDPQQIIDAQRAPVDTISSSSPSHIDALFSNLNSPHSQPHGPFIGPLPAHESTSAPATPGSLHAGAGGSTGGSSTGSAPVNPAMERQSALLSLLGSVSNTNANNTPKAPPVLVPAQQPSQQIQQQQQQQLQQQQHPQQIPTPPGSASAQRSGVPTTNESQGKLLLDQLMSGTAPISNYSDPQNSGPVPSPPYLPPQDYNLRPDPDLYTSNQLYTSPDLPYDPVAHSGSQRQQRADSPARKSLFDIVTPFDALASTSSPPQVKKKPVPNLIAPGPQADEQWSSIPDPKRKSVENLIDQLSRGQGPSFQSAQPVQDHSGPYQTYIPADDPYQNDHKGYARPLPPQPQVNQISSPRSSPPKPQLYPAVQRQQRRINDSPIGQFIGPQGQRDKESSPVPRGPWKGYETRGRTGGKAKSPQAQLQTIMFDVSQPLDDIQAPRDAVKSTAIALVKVDSTFLPGTTIGATHWVAYAMTRGRIRVISRSSGDRTLLQLPPTFGPSTSIIDMAVYGNRLAGVTSDGGFVVWELPEVITDDVPGRILLCVTPTPDPHALRSVKWHPRELDTLALASDTNVYMINVVEASQIYETVHYSDLNRLGRVFSVPSPIVAFDFDVQHSAVATISEDSTLTLWNVRENIPFWSHKIRGDDMPSSINFVDGGVVIGRKNGTVFQLLAHMGRTVLSTLKFVNGNKDDPDMFGHVTYDSRIQTLWVANNRRESMIAFKIGFDSSAPSPDGDESPSRGGYIEQVVEFCGPKPTIHFVILTADLDPTGEEALAACVAAKVPAGELALVAFSVHAGGVDQVLIRREWFDSAFVSSPAKFPAFTTPPPVAPQQDVRPQRQNVVGSGNGAQALPISHPPPQAPIAVAPTRLRTPPSEEVDSSEMTRDEGRPGEGKGKGKGRNVGWKDKEEGKDKDKNVKGGDQPTTSESPLGITLTKEIKKAEENLHTRIGRLISKELDKQHQRMEEARANEQAADFVRQEKILKLISTELTKNTTRVVEMAVKAEVQNSVLPSLESIMKTEVKSALGTQIARGVTDSIKQSIPTEIERVMLRPEVSNQIARTFSSNVTPLIERQIKEVVSKTLIPAYSQHHQELTQEMHTEVMNLRKEILSWQNDAVRNQENVIRELEQSVRMLTDQIKFLTLNAPSHLLQPRSSPAPSSSGQSQGTMVNPSQYRHPGHSSTTTQVPQSSYPQSYGPYQQQIPPIHGPSWFNTSIAAPQASHPTAPPPVQSHSPHSQTEEWDDTYLSVLGTQDLRQLRELLARSNPEVTMPLNGTPPLSQAVILTLVHRLASALGETPPVDESFKSTLWWLQRAASVLNANDPLISPYVARVVPNVQQVLNTTKQRLAILPGGSSLMDAARTISDVQDVLSRKPM